MDTGLLRLEDELRLRRVNTDRTLRNKDSGDLPLANMGP